MADRDERRAGDGDDSFDGSAFTGMYLEGWEMTVDGGAGDDFVAGDEGNDALRGGEGKDVLAGGYSNELTGPGSGVDTGVDSLECGSAESTAQANPWDSVTSCATTQTIRALMVNKVRHNRAKGTARLTFSAYAMKGVTVSIGGRGVKPLTYVSPTPGYYEPKGGLVVRAKGRALAKLRRTGHLRLNLSITWRPTGKPPATEARQVNLVMKKKPRSQATGKDEGDAPPRRRPPLDPWCHTAGVLASSGGGSRRLRPPRGKAGTRWRRSAPLAG